jgi:hypothetical protein
MDDDALKISVEQLSGSPAAFEQRPGQILKVLGHSCSVCLDRRLRVLSLELGEHRSETAFF